MVHDYFRAAVLESPLAALAAELLAAPRVRLFNTFSMGLEAGVAAPQRWHADHGVFPGPHSCGSGLVVWLPLIHPAQYEAGAATSLGWLVVGCVVSAAVASLG